MEKTLLKYNNKNNNSLVTGGVQGIGRSIVDILISRGDNIFVFDIVDNNDDRVIDLKKLGVNYYKVDIGSVESIKSGFKDLFSYLDNNNLTLDILVNNAGVARDSLAMRLKEFDWDFVLDINLKGAFFCCQQALLKMIKNKISYIINISSIVGLVGNPGQVNYAASKSGLISITKTLSREYASRNILVNAIAPGFINTQMTEKLSDKVRKEALNNIPLNRAGTVKDISYVVEFLTSGRADYITGQILNVNGGMVS